MNIPIILLLLIVLALTYKLLRYVYKLTFTTPNDEVNDTLPSYELILALDKRVSRLEKAIKK